MNYLVVQMEPQFPSKGMISVDFLKKTIVPHKIFKGPLTNVGFEVGALLGFAVTGANEVGPYDTIWKHENMNIW